ncbi:helix-turn-helix domain-containing protein [Solirubrobacter soli]|uniref:helix-turn-helix domain-containing protein n=1 Tax=Solirubrobacter soli TaxID=363832 RepID=UPI0003FAD8CA|nr:helix-turn-helix domain-containing protein [Solirubrobacter soli]
MTVPPAPAAAPARHASTRELAPPHRVVALAAFGVAPFELGCVVEVFGLRRPELDVPWWYELRVAAEIPGPLPATAGGFSFYVEHGLEALDDADTIIVPGWHGEPSEEVVDAVRAAHERGARLVSICSGVFLIAATGLLDGREAATHWRYAARLAELHPRVRVNADVLYVDNGSVLTSAGSAAGIDLCLHIVRRDHGSAVANSVARRLVIPPHRDGGQAQLIELPMPAHPDDDPIAGVMAWALERLDDPLDLDTLAARAYMSVRTFTRRFRKATGTTPGRWLLEQRVRASLVLLETSDASIETVAGSVGFASAATFRHHFAAIMHTSPTAYRRAFYAASA